MRQSALAISVLCIVGLSLTGLEARNVHDRKPGLALPNIRLIDCSKAGLSAKTCLIIKFDHGAGNVLVEYAGLKEEEPGIESILSGPLFTSDLIELENSRVSVTLLEEGLDAQIMITGSEGTDQLFQLKVNLETGEAHADTLPQDGVFHFDDEDSVEVRMTDAERNELLTQFNMDRSTMPSQMDLKVQMVIDKDFTDKYGTNSETRVTGVFNHMKTFFLHSSLQVKFNLVKLPTKSLTQKLLITQSNRDVFGDICAQKVASGEFPDAHTYILMSPNNVGGLYGIANGGWNYGFGVCAKDIKWRVSINWYETDGRYDDDLLTALTVVHETGHNLGMQHDFQHTTGRPSRTDSNGNNCKGIAAFMDYVFPPYTESNPMPNKWSGCSVDDFKVHYQLFKNKDGAYCLEGNTTPPPQPPAGTVCTNVKLTTKSWGKEISWAFGSCKAGKTEGKEFGDNNVYNTQCCQPAGNYDFKCIDSYGDGWNGGFVQIGSSTTKLCEDFTSGGTKTVSNVAHEEFKVCVNLKLTTKSFGGEISWEFGSCSSGDKPNYNSNQEYPIQCCQPPGNYVMKCKDSYGDGWNGGFIQVGSDVTKICEDFTTGTEKSVTVNHPAAP